MLYDEDVQMMTERQQQLDKRIEGVRSGTLRLGPVDEITTPLSVSLSQRGFVWIEPLASGWCIPNAAHINRAAGIVRRRQRASALCLAWLPV